MPGFHYGHIAAPSMRNGGSHDTIENTVSNIGLYLLCPEKVRGCYTPYSVDQVKTVRALCMNPGLWDSTAIADWSFFPNRFETFSLPVSYTAFTVSVA